MSGRRLEARPSRRVLTQRRSPAWPAWPLGPGEPGRTGPAVRRRPPVRRTYARPGATRAAGIARAGTSRSRPTGSVTARWHRARLAPAVRVVVLDGRPWPMMPARGAAGRTRSRRPVQAVRARRHPPSVRQPIPARPRRTIGAARVGRRAVGYRPSVRRGPAMRGSAMRGSAVRGSSLWGSAMRRSTPWGSPVLGSPVLGSPVRHATARTVGIRPAPVRPAWMRPARRRRTRRRRTRRRRTHRWCGHRWHARVRAARVRCPAVRERPVRSAAVRVPAARPAAVRVSAVRGRSWREATRLGPSSLGPSGLRPSGLRPSGLRPSRLADPRLPGRHLARAPQQLPEFVVLALTAWPGRIVVLGRVPVVGGIRPGAVAAAVPLVPGRTVRVTAEAGVATFHPIPPGPLCPADGRTLALSSCSVGRQKSPV
jgi:hypothetical protein